MVPSAFVRLDAIPLNRNGKVDRAALPEPAGPDPAADDTPLGPVEEIVQHIWREVCGVEAGAHDDFFGRGGNSILAIRMIAEIRTEFDVTLPVRAVFEAPTIAGIARTIENRIRAEIEEMSDSDIVANTDTDTDTGSDAVPDTGTDTDTGSDADSDTGTGSDASAAAGAQTTNTSTAPSTSTSTDSAYAAAQAKEPNA
ncbi:hypothetical protein SSCG_04727 [Streptomyces clavuligerus]|nr:phosphopantetheine-binding protein [Streptomyces clavuligerus]EDY51699.1 hypothetical protein SSCG_04727 [Streptomyces clavuligerus]